MTANDSVRAWVEDFEAFARGAAASDSTWLGELRRRAISDFSDAGFPTTKLEAWRDTNVSRVSKERFAPARPAEISPEALESLAFPLFACSLFVFVNGRFDASLSTPRALSGGLHVESLARRRARLPNDLRGQLAELAPTKDHPFRALNTALFDDGAVIDVSGGEAEHQPIHIVFATTDVDAPMATHPRVLIRADAGSRATVIQDHVSLGETARLTNSVCEVSLGPGAALDLVLLQREGDENLHFSSLCARLERDAYFGSHVITLGGGLVRNDLTTEFADEGAECRLNGLFLGTGSRHIDNHTTIDHAIPHCTSQQLYKGVLGGSSRGVFRGRVIVRPDAQQTNARQSNPNLLLSERAEVNTKPQLEIHADDVKCSHGSTIGQLDSESLFYLQSRGIDKPQARELLTRGFASEITSALPSEAVGERIHELLLERLERELHPQEES